MRSAMPRRASVSAAQAPEGPPHDLGQFYLLIDPSLSPDFAARFSRVAEAIAGEEGVRMPGAARHEAEAVEVPDALWQQVQALAGG